MTATAIQTARDVLQKCAAYDPWFPHPTKAILLAWAEQIAISRLSRDDLLAGVTFCYHNRGDGFKPLPADVLLAARTIRQDRAMRETPAPQALPPADQDGPGRALAMELVAKIGRDPNLPDPAPGPRRVRCPWCHAPPGSRCVGSTGKPLTRPPYYHPARCAAAEKMQPTHDRAIEPIYPLCSMCDTELINPQSVAQGTCERCRPHVAGAEAKPEEHPQCL